MAQLLMIMRGSVVFCLSLSKSFYTTTRSFGEFGGGEMAIYSPTENNATGIELAWSVHHVVSSIWSWKQPNIAAAVADPFSTRLRQSHTQTEESGAIKLFTAALEGRAKKVTLPPAAPPPPRVKCDRVTNKVQTKLMTFSLTET